MINKILIPTDFSDVAGNALNYGLQLAKKAGAAVHVIHVNHVALIDASMPPETYQLFVAEAEEATRLNFSRLETSALKNSGVTYSTHSRYGFVADEICEEAEKNQCDLIVMGTTGASGIEEIFVGSNAASVIGKSTIPVLVVPPRSSYNELKRIVYASDYNEPEFPAVRRLLHFAELHQAALEVVHIKTEYDHYFNMENNFFRKNKDSISYPNITYKELPAGDIVETINSYAEANQADLIVMAKHNRSFFDRLFHRSLSKKMAFHTHVPLLVLVKD